MALKILRALFLAIMIAPKLHAAPHFVKPGGPWGSQNGSSWDNAAPVYAIGSVSPGENVWLAGGNYGNQPIQIVFNGTASQPIVIRRAISGNSECTSSSGWSNSYDAQVVFTLPQGLWNTTAPSYPNGSYVIIDGMVTNGIKWSCDHRGALPSSGNGGYRAAISLSTTSCTNFFIFNVMIEDVQTPYWYDDATVGSAFGIVTDSSQQIPGGQSYDIRANFGVNISNVYFATMCAPIKTGRNKDLTVQSCTFSNVANFTSGSHADHSDTIYVDINYSPMLPSGWPANITIKNNASINPFNEGFYTASSRKEGECAGDRIDHLYIYGNRVLNYPGTPNGIGNKGISLNTSCATVNDAHAFNNTFVNVWNPIAVSGHGGAYSDVTAFNNLIFTNADYSALNTQPPTTANGWGGGYTWRSGTAIGESGEVAGGNTDPFTSYASKNFHIVTNIDATHPRDKGASLGSPFNIDPDGVSQDTLWDIGAYASTSNAVASGAINISGVMVMNFFPTNATVSWTTDKAASSIIFFGPTTGYGSSNVDATLTTSHSLLATGATGGLVHYKLISVGGAGETTNTSDATFYTANIFTDLHRIEAEGGSFYFPIISNSSGYIQQSNDLGYGGSGECRWFFTVATNGDYTTTFNCEAQNAASNSFWFNVGNVTNISNLQPTDPYMTFHVTNLTTGFENRDVTWQGDTGTFQSPQIVPVTNNFLTGVSYVAIMRGREPTPLDWISFNLVSSPGNTNQAPLIRNIVSMQISSNASTMDWQTDLLSDSVLDYGSFRGNTFTDHITNSTPTINHHIDLTNLVPNGFYIFRVSSATALSARTTSSTNVLESKRALPIYTRFQ